VKLPGTLKKSIFQNPGKYEYIETEEEEEDV
jgi:hypothetical protein